MTAVLDRPLQDVLSEDGLKPVVAYCRLSKNPDGSLDSVARQRRILAEYAQAKGLRVIKYFEDDNLSAWKRGRKRPGWKGLLATLNAGHWEGEALGGALSYHCDRLARSDHAAADFLAALEARDYPLYTPQTGELQLGISADARFTFRILVAVAIKSSDDTSRRVCAQKDDARRRGDLRAVLGGAPPYGFRKNALEPWRWEIDPVAQHLLTACAEAICGDQPYSTLCKLAGTRVNTVLKALRRPMTAGYMLDRHGRIMGDHTLGPVIDRELWRSTQVILTGRELGQRATDQYPFGKVLACGSCGNQLTGEGGLYRCKNPHPDHPKPCQGTTVSASQLHQWLRLSAEAWAAGDPDAAAAFTKRVDHTEERSALQTELLRLQDREHALDLKLDNGRIRQDQYDESVKALDAEFDRVNARLDAMAEAEVTPVPASLDWDAMREAERVATLRAAFVTPIVVRPGGWVPGRPKGQGRRWTISERVPLTLSTERGEAAA